MTLSTRPNWVHVWRPLRLSWRVVVVGAVLAALALVPAPAPAQAAGSTLYVSASAAADPACSVASKTNPFRTVAGALSCANNGNKVSIGLGTFAGGFTITKNVTLVGAGAGTVIADPTAPTLSLTEVSVADGHTVTLSNLTVDGHQAQADVVMGGGSLTVLNTTITGGVATNGGAINMAPSTGRASLTVLRSTLSNNVGLQGAGAIAVKDSAARPGNNVSVIDSTITGNEGGTAGGIWMGNFNALIVRNSTIAGNHGPQGGGLVLPGAAGVPGASTLTLSGSIVADNSTGSGGDCVDHQPGISGGHNVIGIKDGCDGIVNGVNGDQAGTAASPLGAGLSTLAGNGGPTQTLALLAGSPAINAGDPSSCLAAPVSGTDQRGVTRNAKTRVACDVGAYDTSVPLQTLFVKAGTGPDPTCAAATAANPFRTVAGALGCATSGTQVKIGAGTFAGGFTITSNVVLLGAGRTTVIADPSAPGSSLTEVTVADGRFVSLRNLTVNGSLSQPDLRTGSGALTIVSSTLTGGAGGSGPAVELLPGSGSGSVLLLRSTVANNLGLGSGPGAVYVAPATQGAPNVLSIINSTLVGNQAGGNGGAVYVGYFDTLTVRDSTIAGNSAQDNGGGIFVPAIGAGLPPVTPVTLTNVILAGNTASAGPDCWDTQGVTDGGHTILGIQDGTCSGIANGVNGDQAGTAASPLSAQLGPLASNGGPTQTEALLTGSPARSAGSAADCQAFPVGSTDQRGSARHAAARRTCDVGAYDTGS